MCIDEKKKPGSCAQVCAGGFSKPKRISGIRIHRHRRRSRRCRRHHPQVSYSESPHREKGCFDDR